MCGLIGILVSPDQRPAFSPEEFTRARDLMSHRGPDGAGAWDGGHIVLGHRRLAVIDLSPAGAQPFAHPRGVLVYNGELYNDAALRSELSREGWEFKSGADSETVLAALITWGERALARLRGMFALAYYDTATRRTLLARDPLGIKPLYWTRFTRSRVEHLAFASELRALIGLPGLAVRPDLVAASAYLTTIRTTLGTRTLYEGLYTLEPGEAVWIDGESGTLRATPARLSMHSQPPRPKEELPDQSVHDSVAESVRLHLRSDAPTCALLSGGLDSSILCSAAKRELPELWTYCSGAHESGADDDFAHAARVAEVIGSRHTEAPVTAEMFRERWPSMIDALALPLSTPNEVAINEVARRLRADGNVVTLSGEGADELFGGYEVPFRNAAAFEQAAGAGADSRDGGTFQLDDAAWIPRDAKPAILNEDVWRRLESDAVLIDDYRTRFARCRAESGDSDPLQAHFRFVRQVNLAGLLLRLDTATMLQGVEGRTPLADVEIAALADSLPSRWKFDDTLQGPAATKVALRRAFAHDLPAETIARPKASFPLPFQSWVADQAHVLRSSSFARLLFTEAAIASVVSRPADLWRLAWPMINLALWGRRFG
ncbi:asparagine synthase (glutamine-hydrolysing) [Phycisphaerales bacterium]|nr:asparagine synthase (glutamine-hydrolysing) [Phycisphaerales bacterium]